MYKNGSEFISDDEIYRYSLDLIDSAKKEIILVSPWIRLSGHLQTKLIKQMKRDIPLIIVTRPPKNTKDQKHEESLVILKKNGANIIYDPKLTLK